jgi:protein-L-isoaspartate(D-aspartate) O-methyltransferase
MSLREKLEYSAERSRMVQTQLRDRGIRDERVLNAMLRIPRHEFVPEDLRSKAYADHPIPIAENQTISQPFIIAVSLQALALAGNESVLEIGTGSGYQTALLAMLSRTVFSIERHRTLASCAEKVLSKLELGNVRIMVGDGSSGLPQFAPYDAIVVSAAAPSIPRSLLDQLSDVGRIVIPVGPPHAQELQLVRKLNGQLVSQVIEGCRFVPLIGVEGYNPA